ncbi:two-component system, OmpR family, response regulator CssR [Flexibacter flexilis DSM 6793]|uniref:Two-component system, OmpR family, response regulator CssR n=1 Tax=Flexibacter flexilis DSM 6793 TaxID=927664 RepID=A0A1I1IF84_9BACT|nr:response regulator [Flexibacter flexilis]SFC31880.1 two-component system, OmpR family, response regulator CssR [Flexibacter flexilis DSM 6793]
MNRQLFVIEDNRTEGMLFRIALGAIPNLNIRYFADGKSLLEAMPENPAIVLADLMLPDINGYELVKTIREQYPQSRVIVASAQRDIDLIAKIQELGVFNYLVKSEGCLNYLQQVVNDLLTLLNNKQ